MRTSKILALLMVFCSVALAHAQLPNKSASSVEMERFIVSLTAEQRSLFLEALVAPTGENAGGDRASCLKRCDDLYPYTSNENNLNKENRQECKRECRDKYQAHTSTLE